MNVVAWRRFVMKVFLKISQNSLWISKTCKNTYFIEYLRETSPDDKM